MIPATKVLVAGKDLMEGDKIGAGDLSWQEWPKSSLNSTFVVEGVVDPETLIGSVVRYRFLRGEPIILTDLVKAGERGVLAAILAPGKRAASIDVTPATANSGLILPGDYVDVILSNLTTPEGAENQAQQHGKSETILTNIKVVAIDTELSTSQGTTKNPPHVATLEVTPDQAAILLAAAKEGTLSLSLHSLEQSHFKRAEETMARPRRQDRVIVIRGKERTTLEFQEKE